MAIKTNMGSVSRALDFYNKDEIFFCIGKTSPWPDEENPPEPDADSTIEGAIGYKRHEFKYLVVPYDGGDTPDGTVIIDYGPDSKWKAVPAGSAVDEKAMWVYVETTINAEDFPLGDYRQVGLYTNLVRASGVDSNKTTLLPSEVEDPGLLEIIDNRVKVTRLEDTRENLSFIIKF